MLNDNVVHSTCLTFDDVLYALFLDACKYRMLKLLIFQCLKVALVMIMLLIFP